MPRQQQHQVDDSVMGDENISRGQYTHPIAGEHAVIGQGGSRISTGSSVETGQAYAPSSVATGRDEYAPSEGTTQHVTA